MFQIMFRLAEVNIVDEHVLGCVGGAIAYVQQIENIEHSVSYQAPMVNDGSTG